ncbi:MAG: hypothetical protein AB1593_08930 [Pseudomonadota bacterium]
MTNDQYALLFSVRRSVRYHDRRRAFFERLHRLTSVLTVLMAGSVLFEIGRSGETSGWLMGVAVMAAILAAVDMVVGYASRTNQHRGLKERFVELEMAMLKGDDSPEVWTEHRLARLKIERDEPPIYRALDLLCHNELLRAEGGNTANLVVLTDVQRWTRHIFHWPDIE